MQYEIRAYDARALCSMLSMLREERYEPVE